MLSAAAAPKTFRQRQAAELRAALSAVLSSDLLPICAAYTAGRRFPEWDALRVANADPAHGVGIAFTMAFPPQPYDDERMSDPAAYIRAAARTALVNPQDGARLIAADRGVWMTDNTKFPTLLYGLQTLAQSGLTRWAVRLAATDSDANHTLGVSTEDPLRSAEKTRQWTKATHVGKYRGAGDVTCTVERIPPTPAPAEVKRAAPDGAAALEQWSTRKVTGELVYTFDADLEANTLRLQVHRPFNHTYSGVYCAPDTPSPVLLMRLPSRMVLANMRPYISPAGFVEFVDTEGGAEFPRHSHDG